MIKIKGNVVTFTGKDGEVFKQSAKAVGMSPQNFFTGMIWEYIMKQAREGVFLGKKTV
jgi:hypothetical protein